MLREVEKRSSRTAVTNDAKQGVRTTTLKAKGIGFSNANAISYNPLVDTTRSVLAVLGSRAASGWGLLVIAEQGCSILTLQTWVYIVVESTVSVTFKDRCAFQKQQREMLCQRWPLLQHMKLVSNLNNAFLLL